MRRLLLIILITLSSCLACTFANAETRIIEYEQVLTGTIADGHVTCNYLEASPTSDQHRDLGPNDVIKSVNDLSNINIGFPAFMVEGDSYSFVPKAGSTDYSAMGALIPQNQTVTASTTQIDVSCGIDFGETCSDNCKVTKSIPVVTETVRPFFEFQIGSNPFFGCSIQGYYAKLPYHSVDLSNSFQFPGEVTQELIEKFGPVIIKGVPYDFYLSMKNFFEPNEPSCQFANKQLTISEIEGSENSLIFTREINVSEFSRYTFFPRYFTVENSITLPLLESNLDADCDGILNLHDEYPLDFYNHGQSTNAIDDITCDGDMDGHMNIVDLFPHNPSEWDDFDLDGYGDNSDSDLDGDGTPNDSDDFPFDPSESLDTDGDGIGDNSDASPSDSNIAGDPDNDSVDTLVDNCPNTANLGQSDNDNDGIGNACDSDIDGDDIDNALDTHPLNPIYFTDFDGDKLNAFADNCPFVRNAGQSDSDGDGFGNACDNDNDNDGVNDALDSHPLNSLYFTDFDRDLFNAHEDNCPFLKNPGQSDNDGDGLGNACDPDLDGDGVDDVSDNYPRNPNLW